ncbi:hypothetical protein MBLNU459_g5509t2 [Dothideomycetes sp. NU459]
MLPQPYTIPAGSYVNPAFGGLHPQSSTPPQRGQDQSYNPIQYQHKPVVSGNNSPGQKRNREQAFGQGHKHPMKKPTNVPKTQAAPAVPSFGAPLLPQVSAAATPASKGTIGKKKLGLIPQDYDSDESEHDVDEEAAFVDRQSEPLTFEFNGELATLNSSADIAAWIEERKKRWPSKRRIEEKKEEVQKRMQERRRIEEETRAAATKSSSTHDASLGRIALPPHKQKQPKPRNPEARIKETTLDETRKELEKQMQKVEDLQRLLAQSESRAAAAAKSVRDESGGTDESSNEVPRSAEETNNGQDVTQSLITALEESQHELCVSRVEERSNDSGLGPTEGLQTDAHSDQKGRHGDTVLAPEHVAGESVRSNLDTSSEGTSSDSDSDSESDSDGAPEEETSKRDQPPRVPPPNSEQRICSTFSRTGRCKFGVKCRFRHVHDSRGPQPQAQRDPAAIKRKSLYQRMVEQEQEGENKLALQAIKHLGGVGFFSR